MKTSFKNNKSYLCRILCPTLLGIAFSLVLWPVGESHANVTICYCHNICHDKVDVTSGDQCTSDIGQQQGHQKSVDCNTCLEGQGLSCEPGKNSSDCFDGADPACENGVEDTLGKCNGCGNGVLDPGEECDDKNNQDGDGCSADCKKECTSDADPLCDDKDPCTNDTCNTNTHSCEHSPNTGNPCTDGNACTQTDTCVNGVCTGSDFKVCAAPGPCFNQGSCDASTGDCIDNPRNEGSSCGDINQCNGTDSCDGKGNCVQGTPATTCDDGNTCTSDSCDTESGKCSFNAQVGASCSDNNICTLADTCNVDGQCVPGAVNPCDDSNSCTTDSCNAQSAADGGNGCVSVDNGTCGGAVVPNPHPPTFLSGAPPGNGCGHSLQGQYTTSTMELQYGVQWFALAMIMAIPLLRNRFFAMKKQWRKN
jgi:cysteine-rich repeat protein